MEVADDGVEQPFATITTGLPTTQEEPTKVFNVLNMTSLKTFRKCVVPGSKDQERVVPKTLYGMATSGKVAERC
jgi:hypothetical protein